MLSILPCMENCAMQIHLLSPMWAASLTQGRGRELLPTASMTFCVLIGNETDSRGGRLK